MEKENNGNFSKIYNDKFDLLEEAYKSNRHEYKTNRWRNNKITFPITSLIVLLFLGVYLESIFIGVIPVFASTNAQFIIITAPILISAMAITNQYFESWQVALDKKKDLRMQKLKERDGLEDLYYLEVSEIVDKYTKSSLKLNIFAALILVTMSFLIAQGMIRFIEYTVVYDNVTWLIVKIILLVVALYYSVNFSINRYTWAKINKKYGVDLRNLMAEYHSQKKEETIL